MSIMKFGYGLESYVWVLSLWLLILMSLIDFRLKIIPNGIVLWLGGLGILNIANRVYSGDLNLLSHPGLGSSFGHYSLMFESGSGFLANHLIGILFGLLLFGGIYLLSRGRAMGLGDVKLVFALGLLMRWPDIGLALILSFILGSVVGLAQMSRGKLGFKSSVPFGPFIAAGVTLVLFFGYDIVNAYFQLFGLI
jgi:leader peptidase (prepilin peptidase)/N-methyltransferase